jgi:hypothetical protein
LNRSNENKGLAFAEKKPATEAGAALETDPSTPALTPTLPVPITEGISRKLTGIFFEERTVAILDKLLGGIGV